MSRKRRAKVSKSVTARATASDAHASSRQAEGMAAARSELGETGQAPNLQEGGTGQAPNLQEMLLRAILGAAAPVAASGEKQAQSTDMAALMQQLLQQLGESGKLQLVSSPAPNTPSTSRGGEASSAPPSEPVVQAEPAQPPEPRAQSAQELLQESLRALVSEAVREHAARPEELRAHAVLGSVFGALAEAFDALSGEPRLRRGAPKTELNAELSQAFQRLLRVQGSSESK